MIYRQTEHQVARAAFPDAVSEDKVYLFKRCSTLRATYQVRLLAYLAAEAGKKLIIDAPEHLKPHPSLTRLMEEFPKTIRIGKAS